MHNNGGVTKARYLRKEKTKAEKFFWEAVRDNQLGVKFRRQHPIDRFIIDFYAPKINLAIELDGVNHINNKVYDSTRTEFLNSKNITVLRFWNTEVEHNLQGVIEKIKKFL